MFDKMSKASSGAFRNMDKAVGGNIDPDLSLYKKLRPEHFNQIAQQYGLDNTVAYIQAMEKKQIVKGE